MDLSTVALYIGMGLLGGLFVNWLANVLPMYQARAVRVRPRRVRRLRSRTVTLACVALFVYAGTVSEPLGAGAGRAAAHRHLTFDDGVLFLYLALFLLIAVIDLEHRRVLNIVLVPAVLGGLVFAVWHSPHALANALLGGVSGLGLFLIIALVRPGAMGGGDVKLAGLVGVVAGFPYVVIALATGVLAGGTAALLLLLTKRAGHKSTLAYAPYLSLGACVALLHGAQILAWYAGR